MKFPKTKVAIWGGYSVQPEGLSYYISIIHSNSSTIDEIFDRHRNAQRFVSYKNWNRKCRPFDVMALTEDKEFFWWRYRTNGKDPEVKYHHKFTDDEKYIFIATPETRPEYYFDTDYDALIRRISKTYKNEICQIFRICKDYAFNRISLDDIPRDDVLEAIRNIHDASHKSPSEYYHECMKYVMAEVNYIEICDGIPTLIHSYWDIGDRVYRSYKDFETVESCKEYIEDPSLVFDSEYKTEAIKFG